MAEQFLKAFAVDVRALDRVVGCKDEKLLAKILKHDLAEEVAELIAENDFELEEILREIMFGKLDKKKPYTYRRALELVATVVGKTLSGEVTLPGRGWQEIGPAWKHWGQKTLATFWGGRCNKNPEYNWPFSKPSVDWPIAWVIPRAKTAKLKKELRAFREKTAIARGVPKGIDRFSEGERWPIQDLVREAMGVTKTMAKWCKNTDVLVWHDGQG